MTEILTALDRLTGQTIGKRLLDQLPGGRVEWRLSRELGYTFLRNRAYRQSGAAGGIELVLAPGERSDMVLDAAWVRAHQTRT